MAVSIVLFLTIAAFSVDVGYMTLVRTELQRSVDSAALAAASVLNPTGENTAAQNTAIQYCQLNQVASLPVSISTSNIDFGRSVYDEQSGKWDFYAGSGPYTSVLVRAPVTAGLFFGRIAGSDSFTSSASAVATLLPRDIVVVTDLSGSMCYDSSIMHEGEFDINIYDIWLALGSPTFGNMQAWNQLQYLTGEAAEILDALGLDATPYPFPQGSWAEYVGYVQAESHLISKGYQHQYGLKTWVDYLLVRRRYKSNTPVLSDTPQQPMTAVKQSVDAMMNYLDSINSHDLVGLVSYDSAGHVEHDLTTDLAAIKARMHYLQAGAWGSGTNIGAGIREGRQILTGSSARESAHKVILLLTDGLVNRADEGYSPADYALYQAQLAADQGMTIHTISFSDFADQSLMAQIAAIGGGEHFHVPSYTIDQYTSALQDVFLKLSSFRRAILTR